MVINSLSLYGYYTKQCKMDGYGKQIQFNRPKPYTSYVSQKSWKPLRTNYHKDTILYQCYYALVDCRYGIPPPKHPQVATTEAAVVAAEFQIYSGSEKNKITWAIVTTTSWRLSVNNTSYSSSFFEWSRFYYPTTLATNRSCIYQQCEIITKYVPLYWMNPENARTTNCEAVYKHSVLAHPSVNPNIIWILKHVSF